MTRAFRAGNSLPRRGFIRFSRPCEIVQTPSILRRISTVMTYCAASVGDGCWLLIYLVRSSTFLGGGNVADHFGAPGGRVFSNPVAV